MPSDGLGRKGSQGNLGKLTRTAHVSGSSALRPDSGRICAEDDWSYDKLGVWRLLSDSVAPVARLVATNDAWWEAVYYMQYNATFYWWLPDATFGMLRPERIAFREVEEAATDIALKACISHLF